MTSGEESVEVSSIRGVDLVPHGQMEALLA